ncbi:peptidoglycan/LPS O-acetylase OafA/YrhL [Nocardia sp. GAS34]|uniref:acyltransferase n=1 Tax=unclassified Nocardia TaxID=2637762 RepID=UPI003D2546D9
MSVTVESPTRVTDEGTRTTRTGTAARPKRAHLHQIDLFRILTFACVIGAHVVGNSLDPGNVPANGVAVILHFTRQAFFALTGFVLIYQYGQRPLDTRAFWRKRFPLVGIPYLAWSVLYWVYSIVAGLHPGESMKSALWRLVFETATGGAWYQLYFLLVTMQVYLLFPLILKLLRATRGHHRWVLAVSATLQVGALYLMVHPPVETGRPAGIWNHLFATVLPYQFYVVLGAAAAWHIESVTAAIRRFGPLLLGGGLLATVVSELIYFRQLRELAPWQASNVFMLHLLVCYTLIIAAQYTLSSWWAAHRREDHATARIVKWGSDRSFGVFLVHPLALQILAPVIPDLQSAFGLLWGTVVLYICVLTMAIAATEVLRRIPGSLWLTGRPMLHTDPFVLVRRFRRERAPQS